MAKLGCPECGGNLFSMTMRQCKPSWRCCTRPTHVFEMDGDRMLVPVVTQVPDTDDHRMRLAEALHRGCNDDDALLKRLGDL